MSIFKDLWWFFKFERKSYLLGTTILIVVALLNIIPPYIVGIIIDSIRNNSLTPTTLVKWIGLIFAIALTLYVFRYLWRLMIFGASSRLSRLLRNKLFTHFTKQSPDFYSKEKVGDLMAHATNDIQAVEMTAGEGVLTLVDSIITGGIVIITMASTISWKLTLICLLPMPFMAYITNHYGNLIHDRFFKAQAAFSTLNDKVQESISGIRVIKAFGQENAENKDFSDKSQDTVNKNVSVAKIDALFDPTISLIVGLSYFLAISFGSKFVIQETLTLGQLTTFSMYLGHLVWPMLAFGWLFNIVERGRASYDRITNLLDKNPEITDKVDAFDKPPEGEIKYAIYKFSYPEKKSPVLKDIYFSLKKGQTLGIIGKTGSGKTTLLKLLLREYDLTDGNIFIGSNSIYDYKLYSLRTSIGYVPQDNYLFSTNIAENIAFTKIDTPINEIKETAKMAMIHEDIMQFEDKYGTQVGEKGVTLSGGQKQRISIARALLINPEILLLDDSLSAVDAKTEEAILKNLKINRLNKTTLIATHRISAVVNADLIIVLEKGDIVERGTHNELIQNNGWYKEMYTQQKLESLIEKGGE